MQINKPKKQPRRQSSNTLFDNDFAAGFEDSKLDKFKPVIKVLVGIIVLMTAIWGVSAYFGSTDTKNGTNKDYTPNTTVEQTEDDSKTQDTKEAAIESENPASSQNTVSPSTTPPRNATNQSSSDSSPSSTKPYDPSKCEPHNDESKMWRAEADKTYAIIQRATDSGGSVPDSVMDTWKDQLDKGNKAYEKFQQCRASLWLLKVGLVSTNQDTITPLSPTTKQAGKITAFWHFYGADDIVTM